MIPERFQPVLAELAPLSDRFRAAGFRLYLVGGTVRDLLAGRTPAHGASGELFDFDATTDAPPRRDQAAAARLGRRDLDAGRALRHDRRQEARAPRRSRLRDHHPPRRGLPRRLAQARRRVQRPDRGRPVAPRLHHQRDGAGAHHRLADAGRPVRRCRRSAHPHPAHAAGAGDQLQRRPAAHAARGPLHRPPAGHPGARAGRGREGDEGAAGDRVGRAHSRRARQADHPAAPDGRAVVRHRHRPGRRVPARAADDAAGAGPDPSPQGRAHAHPGRGGERAPAGRAAARTARSSTSAARAWRRCSTTSASRALAGTRRARASRSTTTTRSARA